MKLPLKLEATEGCNIIVDAQGICVLNDFVFRDPEGALQNMQAIVTACNAHDPLVDALRAADALLRPSVQIGGALRIKEEQVAFAKIDAALTAIGSSTGKSAFDQMATALKLVQELCGDEVDGRIVGDTPGSLTLDQIIANALAAAGAA